MVLHRAYTHCHRLRRWTTCEAVVSPAGTKGRRVLQLLLLCGSCQNMLRVSGRRGKQPKGAFETSWSATMLASRALLNSVTTIETHVLASGLITSQLGGVCGDRRRAWKHDYRYLEWSQDGHMKHRSTSLSDSKIAPGSGSTPLITCRDPKKACRASRARLDLREFHTKTLPRLDQTSSLLPIDSGRCRRDFTAARRRETLSLSSSRPA